MKTGKKNLVLVLFIIAAIVGFSFLLNFGSTITGNLISFNATHDTQLDIDLLLGDKINSINDEVKISFGDREIFSGDVFDIFESDLNTEKKLIEDYDISEILSVKNVIVGYSKIFFNIDFYLKITGYDEVSNSSILIEADNDMNLDLNELFNDSYSNWNVEIINYTTNKDLSLISEDLSFGFDNIDLNLLSADDFEIINGTLSFKEDYFQLGRFFMDDKIYDIETKNSILVQNPITIVDLENLLFDKLSDLFLDIEIINYSSEFKSVNNENITVYSDKLNADTFSASAYKDMLLFDFQNFTIDLNELDYLVKVDDLNSKNLTLEIENSLNSTFYNFEINVNSGCSENWSCQNSGYCSIDGFMDNDCVDLNVCGTEFLKPPESVECVYSCSQKWECTTFSECRELGFQKRDCADANHCERYNEEITIINRRDKPNDIQSCKNDCNEFWECGAWSGCNENGKKVRSCKDLSSCGTSVLKPLEEVNCNIIVNENDLNYYDFFIKSDRYELLNKELILEKKLEEERKIEEKKKIENRRKKREQLKSIDNLNIVNVSKIIANNSLIKNDELDEKEVASTKSFNNELTGNLVSESEDESGNYFLVLIILSGFITSFFVYNHKEDVEKYFESKKANNDISSLNNHDSNFGVQQTNNMNTASNPKMNVFHNYSDMNSNDHAHDNNHSFNNLNDYINYCRTNNYSDGSIYNMLKQYGYSDFKISKALHFGKQSQYNSDTGKENVFYARNMDFTKSMLTQNVSEESIILSLQKRGLKESDALEHIDRCKEQLNLFK